MKIGTITNCFNTNMRTKTNISKVFNDLYKNGFNNLVETLNLSDIKIKKMLTHESKVISDDPIIDLVLYQNDKYNNGNYDTNETYNLDEQMLIGPNNSIVDGFKYGYTVCKGNINSILKIKFDSYESGLKINNKVSAIQCIVNSLHFTWLKYIYIDPIANDNTLCSETLYITMLKNIKRACTLANVKIIVDLFNVIQTPDNIETKYNNSVISNGDAVIFRYNNFINNSLGFNTINSFTEDIIKKVNNKEIFINFDDEITDEKDTFNITKNALQFAENSFIPLIDCYYISDHLFKKIAYIVSGLSGYDNPDIPNKIYDDFDVESTTFSDKSNMMTIIWIKTNVDKQILLYPNPNQHIVLKNGDLIKIAAKYLFDGKAYEFLLIKQTVNALPLDYVELENLISNKRFAEDSHINSLLSSLPTNYNINTELTNLYKILRSINFELADVDANIAITNDNAYLLSVHNDAIYKNFGVLANLNQESDWNSKKYKAFVSGVIKSLLAGPTIKSIEDAVNLFINYEYEFNNGEKIANVTVTEAYKEPGSQYTNYSKAMSMFTFYVEIESLNENEPLDSKLISRDVNYIVTILKPAHTLAIVQIAYSREENYREWYFENRFDEYGNNKEFETMDEFELEYSIEPSEDNYNLNPCSFITLGDLTVKDALLITEQEHKNIFDGLDTTQTILYGSCTIDIGSGSDYLTYNDNQKNMFNKGKNGNAEKITVIIDGNAVTAYYNQYPLGIITKIQEIEFTISIL